MIAGQGQRKAQEALRCNGGEWHGSEKQRKGRVEFSTATARQRTEKLRGDQQRNSIAGTAELRYAEAMVWNERQRQRVDWLRVAKEQLSLDMRREGIATN